MYLSYFISFRLKIPLDSSATETLFAHIYAGRHIILLYQIRN